jgi:hypothetical protein
LFAAVGLAVGLAAAAQAREVPFVAGGTVTSGVESTFWAELADVDRDGDADLVVGGTPARWFENTDGAGTYGTAQLIGAAFTTGHLADVNRDGKLDLVAGSFSTDEVAWYANNGGASWPKTTITTAADGVETVWAADLDGDGDLDVLTGSENDNELAWHENTDGLGSFGTEQVIETGTGFERVETVSAADLDGDGDLDVLAGWNSAHEIVWYENTDGAGSFGTAQVLASVNIPRSIRAADLDGDGDLDVLVASLFDDWIVWVPNTGGGSFGPAQSVGGGFLLNSPRILVATDLDADGDLDVASAGGTSDSVVWFENTTGTGTFAPAAVISASPDNPYSVTVGDIDGDGDLDVASASANDDTVAWYRNETIHRSASFGIQTLLPTLGDLFYEPVSADVDGDGDPDLVIRERSPSELVWYENTASGFGTRRIIASGSLFYTYRPGDLDGDGDVDLVSHHAGGQVVWLENGGGAVPTWTEHDVGTPSGGSVRNVAFADLDRDGDLDVLHADSADAAFWHENDGLSPPGWITHTIVTATDAWGIGPADVDGDGDLDVLLASSGDEKVDWYENDGTPGGLGDWVPHPISATSAFPRRVIGADLDRDGDLDVVVGGSDLAWYENTDGLGAFGSEQTISGRAVFESVAVADLNADGLLDVAFQDGPLAGWFENDGGLPLGWVENQVGSSQQGTAFDPGLTTADVDGDGDVDVVGAFRTNNPTPPLTTSTSFSSSTTRGASSPCPPTTPSRGRSRSSKPPARTCCGSGSATWASPPTAMPSWPASSWASRTTREARSAPGSSPAWSRPSPSTRTTATTPSMPPSTRRCSPARPPRLPAGSAPSSSPTPTRPSRWRRVPRAPTSWWPRSRRAPRAHRPTRCASPTGPPPAAGPRTRTSTSSSRWSSRPTRPRAPCWWRR